MKCAEDSTAGGEALSELGSLKSKALEFLCKSGQEGKDAARGKQVLMLRAYVGHDHCVSVDCPICISIVGSGLRILQWAQNQAFGCGVFRPSTEVQEQRMKHSADWTGYIVKAESEKDFKGLPVWLQEAIVKDIQNTMAPPKPQPQSVGVAVDLIDKKQGA
jgi:hypothetical protein